MEHDRDLNSARNLDSEGTRLCLAQGLLVGGDRRRTYVDGRGSCQHVSPGQVLPVEACSGQLAAVGTEPAAQLVAQSSEPSEAPYTMGEKTAHRRESALLSATTRRSTVFDVSKGSDLGCGFGLSAMTRRNTVFDPLRLV